MATSAVSKEKQRLAGEAEVVEFGNEIATFPHGFGAAPHTSTTVLELDVDAAALHVCAIGTAQEEEFAAVFQEEKLIPTSSIDVAVAALTCRKETLTAQSKSDVTAATDSPHGVVSAPIGSNKDPKQVQKK
ncbi:hypothetical protein ACH5RR_034242 [Cinchona calisaya]|uniref:Uncharacterized protein n=1 Tax=Cinchona calisaya TaxID=153742 RepID=A0ABD2YCH6_9GENT